MVKTITSLLKKCLLSLIFVFGCLTTTLGQTGISNAAGLTSISSNLSGSYILTADIVLTGSWTPIANFTGTLDGNGHIISGLSYNNSATGSIALFASTSGATIKKIGIENANLIGQQNVAGIIGVMTGGTLEQCYVSNSYIQGTDHVASLVGQALSNAVVKNCYASAYIYATSNNTGGLIGSSKASTLSKCYFSGMVRGAGVGQQAAGLVGFIENGFTPVVEYSVNLAPCIISNAGTTMRIIPNIGRNATLTSNYSLSSSLLGTSYSLTALASVSTSNTYYGITGKNGANLPNEADAKLSAFYSGTLGWDFTPITGVWKMLNDGYPILQWQTAPINTTVLNSGASTNLNILDVTNYALASGGQIDFSKLISSHGISLNVSCASPKVSISSDKIATISSGTTITATENVSVNISAVNSDFMITNPVGTLKLSPGIPFPNFSAYPNGVISDVYNAGPGLAIDQSAVTTEDSKMVVVSSTNATTFNAYIQTLFSNGFTQIATNNIDNNIYYTLMNNNKLYYLYFTASTNQVRIIQDNSSRTLLSALDASSQGTSKTEFYLYSLDYTHGEGQTSKMDYWKIDCGALLIVKLKDNSLFIIDSGHQRQSSNAAMEGLLNFMYKITGQEAGSTLNIRGWFFSHPHGDHVYLTYPFLTKYHDVLNVESVMFNIQSYQTMSSGYDSGTFLMKQAFNTYYPNCKYVKLHTGQVFTLQGVIFNVLHTHEDVVSTAGKTTIGDSNDSSTILKMIMDGKSFMLLADASSICQSDMLSMYSSATLQSDCVQTAHHGFNNLTSLYAAIKAPLAFFCNSPENVSNNPTVYAGVINATTNVKVIYTDPYTSKVTVENGSLVTENVPSYRSYFVTVKIPDLSVGTVTTSGNKTSLSTVLTQTSLAPQVIDKSVTGTGSVSTSESCSLILDGTTSTKYCADSIPNTIAWTMKQPVTLKWYVIYTANDNATNAGRNPQKWALYGSNNGISWICIDSVSNGGLPDANYTGTAFAITNPRSYTYFAIKTFTNGGANVMQFSEIGLYGDVNTVTGINESLTDNNVAANVFTNGNKQVTIKYKGSFNNGASVSLYDMLGQKLIDKRITDSNTVIAVPTSGVYIVKLKDSNADFVQKIRID